LQCCNHCTVTLNPYDTLRLAEALGVSTETFIFKYVDESNWTLKHKPDGGCALLGDDTCNVYLDRPLPCRLYPLGRIANTKNDEQFRALELHPESAGEYGQAGTINSYLELQDADRHLYFADQYLILFSNLLEHLQRHASDKLRIRDMVLDHLCVQHQLLSEPTRRSIIAPILDGDNLVTSYCTEQNLGLPNTLDEKADLQLRAAKLHLGQITTQTPIFLDPD
jgi:Fe-S-cluster containining protein